MGETWLPFACIEKRQRSLFRQKSITVQEQLSVIQPSWNQDEIMGLLPEWLCGDGEQRPAADTPHSDDNNRPMSDVSGRMGGLEWGDTMTNHGHAVQPSRKWGYNWEIMLAYVTVFSQAGQLQGINTIDPSALACTKWMPNEITLNVGLYLFYLCLWVVWASARTIIHSAK